MSLHRNIVRRHEVVHEDIERLHLFICEVRFGIRAVPRGAGDVGLRVLGYTTDQADTEGASVVPLVPAMCAHATGWSPHLNISVALDHEVITDTGETTLAMDSVDRDDVPISRRWGSGAVYEDGINAGQRLESVHDAG